jgi:hypothetical protein
MTVLFGTLSHVHLPHILSFYSYKNNCHFIIDVYNILCCGGFLSSKFIVSESEMEDHKELFYMKLLEYEENLPKHYDKEKFVLSGLRSC